MIANDSLSHMKLDHLMIAAADWQFARDAYRRLGFNITPLRRNAPMGGADGSDGGSQLIMLRGRDDSTLNYLEISTAVPAKAAPLMNRILAHDGPAMMVNFSEQIDETEAAWRDIGYGIHRFDATFPASGSLGGGTFSIVIIDPDDSTLQVNAVFSSDRSAYQAEEWFHHPNGALAWTDVYCVIPDAEFERVNRFFAQTHNQQTHWVGAGRTTYQQGQVKAHLMSITAMAYEFGLIGFEAPSRPVIAGYRIAVTRIDDVERLLTGNAIAYQRSLDVVTVGPADTCGSIIQFAQAK
jgi:hypothetical protein